MLSATSKIRINHIIGSFSNNCLLYLPSRTKKGINYSLVPSIKESDLEEKFIRGSGPGGSAVNKNSNCVVITHIPTGIVVKCHQSRCQDENRKIARKLLIERLDDRLNGDQSVSAQIKALEEKKSRSSESKRKKMNALKTAWKLREGIE